jgi:hypothetical protein
MWHMIKKDVRSCPAQTSQTNKQTTGYNIFVFLFFLISRVILDTSTVPFTPYW